MSEHPFSNNIATASLDEPAVSAPAPAPMLETPTDPLPLAEASPLPLTEEVAPPVLNDDVPPPPAAYEITPAASDIISSAALPTHADESATIPATATATADFTAVPVISQESQPSSERPIEHSAPGISSVADFLPPPERPADNSAPEISSDSEFLPPSDNTFQPIPSSIPPPQETIPPQAQEDAVMTDALPDIPKLEVPQPEPVQESIPAPEPVPAPPAPTPVAEPESIPALVPEPALSEPVQQHTPAPDPIEVDAQTGSAQATHAPSVITPEQSFSTMETAKEPAEQLNGDASVSTPVSSTPIPPEPSVAPPSEPKVETPQYGSDMADNIVVGTTRPREEDDDATDEPTAKRSRVDETAVDSVPVTDDFKRPEAPAPAAPSSVTTNGTATSHLPPRSTYSTEPLTHIQRKVLEEKIKNTKKVKSAFNFLRPVDPVALNIPNYPLVIKNPMDIGTMEQKLKADQYSSLEDFVGDFELMVNNCFTFNGPAHAVSVAAQNLRAYFLKQMDSVPTGDAAVTASKPVKKESPVPKPQPHRESRASISGAKPPTPSGDTFALLPGGTPQIRRDSNAGRPKRTVVPPPSRDLPYSGSKPKRKENMAGLKFCDHVLDELRKPRYHMMNMYFLEPVDPVALNIPHYFKVIRQPMDMQKITNKLKNNQYSAAEEFKADFELMFANCYKFNPPDNVVFLAGKQFQSEFEALWKTKNEWIKKHQPRSQRASPASDDDSDSDESSDGDDDGEDEKEETIRKLKEQLAAMQNMLGTISGSKRDSPKASGKKKNRSSGGVSKSKKVKESKSASKSKPKKQRLVTYEEKQEISNATEQMDEAQIGRLTTIITENVSKYKDMGGDDVELEIDDLPNEVQHKLLKYVRSIFPRPHHHEEPDDFAAIDDDYEPSARAKAAAGSGRKKHKPMKKADQERRIAELMDSIGRVEGGSAQAVGPGAAESSGDEDSESSEEE